MTALENPRLGSRPAERAGADARHAPLRTRIRHAAALGALRSGLLSACEFAVRGRLMVLCYHRVLPAAQRADYHDAHLAVTPETFRAHCRILSERYAVEPLGSALATLRQGRDRPLAAITFDDGYRDNIRHALPILEQYGLKATFFPIAGLVDTDDLPWYDLAGAAWRRLHGNPGPAGGDSAWAALARAKTLSPSERAAWLAALRDQAGPIPSCDDDLIMTGAQVRRLAEAGHEIGSHTMTHPLLPQCGDAELAAELESSRRRLSELAGAPVAGVSYPNGDVDARVRRCSAEAGYAYGAGAKPGSNDRRTVDAYDIRRWFIDQERLSGPDGQPSDALFRMEICGLAQRLFRRGGAG